MHWTVSKKCIYSPADFVRLPTDKEMIGLFQQWETEQQKHLEKRISKSYTLIYILMSQISIWSPIN